ncbi:hypothetical protein Tco_0607466, partial [Tanacetum coccineum]
ERTVKQLRSARLVGDTPATEGDVDIQDADDPDSAGGSSFHPAGSTPMSGSAVPDTADSDNSSSPSPVSTDHIPIDVLFDSTSGGL